jgi:LysM repeat protein
VVQRGDTLYQLAVRYGTTVYAIANANNIANINLIFVGQGLVIP